MFLFFIAGLCVQNKFLTYMYKKRIANTLRIAGPKIAKKRKSKKTKEEKRWMIFKLAITTK